MGPHTFLSIGLGPTLALCTFGARARQEQRRDVRMSMMSAENRNASDLARPDDIITPSAPDHRATPAWTIIKDGFCECPCLTHDHLHSPCVLFWYSPACPSTYRPPTEVWDRAGALRLACPPVK